MANEWRRIRLSSTKGGFLSEFDVKVDEAEKVVPGLRYLGYFDMMRTGENWFSPAVIFADGKVDWGTSEGPDMRYATIDLHGAQIDGYPVRYEYFDTVETLETTYIQTA
jgi:hypothetical protein